MNATPGPADLVSPSADGGPSTEMVPFAVGTSERRQLKEEFTRFMMQYKFGVDEILTKISILREEFNHAHDYNPIEHVSSRLKSPEGIIEKVRRKGFEPSFETIRHTVTDIAGVRITCSFISDTYRVFDMLTSQSDITVLQVKDYIDSPKENGYKSLHAIVEVPVFLTGGEVPVVVEIQFRTIAMDFWASLEHKIYYKYDKQVPQELLDGLKEAADTANMLDEKMQRLHAEVSGVKLAQDLEQRLQGGRSAQEGFIGPAESLAGLIPADDTIIFLDQLRRDAANPDQRFGH